MVGGYVILTKNPLRFGTNDMVPVYGSVEACKDRLNSIIKSRKPVLAEFYIEGTGNIGRAWFEVDLSSASTLVLVSVQAKITVNSNTGALVLSLNE